MEGKEEIIKSIRFSKEEFYLLECCKNKKFSTFIKELLSEYIKNQNMNLNNNSNIDIEKIKAELKEEIKSELKIELLQELRKEEIKEVPVKEVEEKVKANDPKNEDAKKALFNLMGRK